MIRVLAIEDDDRVVGQLREWLDACAPQCEVVVAANRADATAHLSNVEMEFDLVICDLRIPLSPGSIDAREEYGIDVHEVARSELPGVPCIFFTGHADDTDLYDEIARGPSEDLFGNRTSFPLVQLVRKIDFDRARDYLDRMACEWRATDSIELQMSGGLDLSSFQARVVRIFARRHSGDRVELERLGGLSGAKTFRARVFDSGGARQATAFGKIGPLAAVMQEERSVGRYGGNHLDPSCIPTVSDRVRAGGGRHGGLFFAMAERFDRSLFDVLAVDEAAAVASLRNLREATRPWCDAAERRAISVGDLRRRRTEDRVIEQYSSTLSPLDWRRLEDEVVEMTFAPQHGDMHGHNVLLDADQRLMLIDFGETGVHPVSLDPVVLEMSLVFHRDRPQLNRDWPDVAGAASWSDLDGYCSGSPFARFVRECRSWAQESPSNEVGAAILTYVDAIRQLKYPDTQKAVAAAMAVAAGSRALELLS